MSGFSSGDQAADTDGLACTHDPLEVAALYDRIDALEALVLATTPAGYVPGREVERVRAVLGGQSAETGRPVVRASEGEETA